MQNDFGIGIFIVNRMFITSNEINLKYINIVILYMLSFLL